jgi:hypothetical protein
MHKKTIARTPIPWVYKANPIITTWVWETEHFILTVYAEGLLAKKLYNWKIGDKTRGKTVPFDSSNSDSFNTSVDAALEVIGKSYPRDLGYQQYTGELSTTFVIADGRKLDFSSLIGETVVVRAHDGEGGETVLNGVFDVRNYDFFVQTAEKTGAVIPPTKVIDIRKEYGSMSALDALEATVKTTKNNRIIHQEWVKGCTGRPGFNPGTVAHSPNDSYCPIHNL